jgi:LPPG:FO 2-phospho-L-lactate transferase
MPSIAVLCGGVGAARFLEGLVQVVPPHTINAIINTGDDIELHGLAISPDVDIVLCTLAGLIHPGQGWGIVDDTDHCMHMLARLGAPNWFMLGDKDLALHIQRTALLKQGQTATQIALHFGLALGVAVRLLPMTHQDVQTHIETPDGSVHFQHYLVRDRAKAQITGISYHGIATAVATDEVWAALRSASRICIAPSNPIVSVGTILALPGVRDFLTQRTIPVTAVSPIVGGGAIKGPLVPMLVNAGYEVSPLGIAQWYLGLIDTLVIDTVDAAYAPAIRALGINAVVTDTIMRDAAAKAALAQVVLAS